MDSQDLLEKKSIDAAIHFQWNEAALINKQIISQDKANLSAYLRMGFAYMQLKNYKEAKKAYNKALKIQSVNQLAKENLEKIKILETIKHSKNNSDELCFDPNLFLEIPGKTKSISLINVGQKDILVRLIIGQMVFLNSKRRRVEIRTKTNEYVGSLPDDLSKRLILFMKAGSVYSAFIKETDLNKTTVFIREDKKGRKVLHYPSFPNKNITQLSELINDESESGEDEETSGFDLEKLAESLENEEKDYMPFEPEDEDGSIESSE